MWRKIKDLIFFKSGGTFRVQDGVEEIADSFGMTTKNEATTVLGSTACDS